MPRDNPKNSHLPEMAGDIVEVDETLIVDTGLRKIQSFSATLATQSVATAASVDAVLQALEPGGTYKLLLEVWEADGATAASTVANVAWTAIGE